MGAIESQSPRKRGWCVGQEDVAASGGAPFREKGVVHNGPQHVAGSDEGRTDPSPRQSSSFGPRRGPGHRFMADPGVGTVEAPPWQERPLRQGTRPPSERRGVLAAAMVVMAAPKVVAAAAATARVAAPTTVVEEPGDTSGPGAGGGGPGRRHGGGFGRHNRGNGGRSSGGGQGRHRDGARGRSPDGTSSSSSSSTDSSADQGEVKVVAGKRQVTSSLVDVAFAIHQGRSHLPSPRHHLDLALVGARIRGQVESPGQIDRDT